MKANLKSWKTSLLGTGALIPTIADIINKLTDGDPATVVDWNVSLPLLCAGVAGLLAKDGDASSKKLGIE